MTFPTISYKYNGVEHADALTTLTDQKLSSLSKFIAPNTPALCEVEFEKVASHQQGRIYRVEANLTIDGTLYRTEATEETFEYAIDEVRNELDKKIRREKDKQTSFIRRAGHKLKEQFFRNS